MTLQNAPPGLDYERDKRFSKVCVFDKLFIHLQFGSEYLVLLQSFKEMVAACLVKDPKKRPSSEKLLKHPFFKQARGHDYLARTILDGLPPLGDRFRMLKVLCPSYTVLFWLIAFPNYTEITCDSDLYNLNCSIRLEKQIIFYRTRQCMRTRTIYHR